MIYSCLAKKDWRISKPNEKEEFICSSDFGGKKVLPYRRRIIVIKQPNLLEKNRNYFIDSSIYFFVLSNRMLKVIGKPINRNKVMLKEKGIKQIIVYRKTR